MNFAVCYFFIERLLPNENILKREPTKRYVQTAAAKENKKKKTQRRH
jgi:hypothetical protein